MRDGPSGCYRSKEAIPATRNFCAIKISKCRVRMHDTKNANKAARAESRLVDDIVEPATGT